MWELICHHQYRWGTIAADRSKWRSDGRAASVTPLPGDAGLRFATQQSRVIIPRKEGDAWGSIRAIRVEIVASRPHGAGFGHLGGGGTLIDADQSFRVGFDGGLQEIIIQMLGQTVSFRPDLPADNWVTISFWHDGVNQLHYGWSYTLASGLGEGAGGGSPFYVPGQVPPVGPEGVWIGNRIGAPAGYLNGNIQSVKIWRLDPNTMIKKFLGRPFTPSQLDCWIKFKKKLDEVTAQDPECAVWLDRTIGQIRADFLQRLSQKSPEKVGEFQAMCTAYQELWAAGKVGSPEMKALMARLRDWLKSEHLFAVDDPDLQGTLSNPCFRTFTAAVGGIECDPQSQALLNSILGV
jgi:hypothetical protein